MTEAEIEKQSDGYVNRVYKHPNSVMNIDGLTEVMVKQAFQNGAKWGAEHAIEWHDLRKDPNDLPKENKVYIVAYRCYQNEDEIVKESFEWICDSFVDENYEYIPWFDCKDVLIAWCELPQFKE